MSKLDELKNRERELLYQLEDNGKENYRTKELIETFEGYDRASHRYQSDLWEAAYQSRYAGSYSTIVVKENIILISYFTKRTTTLNNKYALETIQGVSNFKSKVAR